MLASQVGVAELAGPGERVMRPGHKRVGPLADHVARYSCFVCDNPR